MSRFDVVAFYKFTKLTDPAALQAVLQAFCKEHQILGTVLVASEGVNGTLAGSEQSIQALVLLLKAQPGLEDLQCKYSYAEFMPFKKTKIILKKEIVALKCEGVDPTQKTGKYVAPQEWNALISNEDILVIDTRNDFEVALGTFKNAIDPKTKVFRDFPIFVKEHLSNVDKKQKIAMCCTGGIRCEKASSYLLDQGFENVYQLEGGILKYLEKIDNKDSLWQGECFIFDDRIFLGKEAIKVTS